MPARLSGILPRNTRRDTRHCGGTGRRFRRFCDLPLQYVCVRLRTLHLFCVRRRKQRDAGEEQRLPHLAGRAVHELPVRRGREPRFQRKHHRLRRSGRRHERVRARRGADLRLPRRARVRAERGDARAADPGKMRDRAGGARAALRRTLRLAAYDNGRGRVGGHLRRRMQPAEDQYRAGGGRETLRRCGKQFFLRGDARARKPRGVRRLERRRQIRRRGRTLNGQNALPRRRAGRAC